MVKNSAFIIATVIAAIAAGEEYSINDFKTKLFWKRPQQGYYDVNVGLPADTSMRVMSIGDLNNDKLNDLVMLDSTGTKGTVYYFDDDTGTYAHNATFELPSGYTCDGIIPTAIPTPLQDLIVLAQKTDSTSGDVTETKLFYYKQSDLGATSTTATTERYAWTETANDLNSLTLYPGSHPLALDINGDQAMDLLYQDATDGVKVALGSRTSMQSYTTSSFFSEFVLTADQNADCKTPNTDDLISLPNSNSFVDLNGDCIPDLILTRQTDTPAAMTDDTKTVSTYYEIYSQVFVNNKSMYCLSTQNGQLVDPKDIRSTQTGSAPMPFIEIADFNRDGMLDMAFASEKGVLNILLNQFSAPGPKATNLCNDVGNTAALKTDNIFPSYPFSAGQEGVIQEAYETMEGAADMTVAYDGLTPSIPKSTSTAGVLGRMRVQDVDQDGYPDFAITMSFIDSTNENSPVSLTKSVILLNKEGDNGERTMSTINSSGDTYLSEVATMAGDSASFMTFIDIDDDGKLDFILQKDTDGVPEVKILYNNIVSDNFFIKALSVNSELKKSQNIYNDYTVGASYRFVITDMEDNRLVTVGSQRYQSGYMSLQLPFAFLGIGRSNNYVETFYAATSIDGKRAEHMWTPIIPNSQLIIFMNSNDETNWGLELFISPTTSLYVIVMVCALCLVAIGLAIIWLHVKEKQEDAKKREQHFDFF